MKFFKENPIYCTLLVVLLLLFAGGATLSYQAYTQSNHHSHREGRAESQAGAALRLEPAPTEANLEAAKGNVSALEDSLKQQIASTKGTKAELLDEPASNNPSEVLFQLQGYREELARKAAQIVPINVNVKSVEDGNVKNPGVKIPDNFAFGFGRYISTGTPPKAGEVRTVHLQRLILTYVLEHLLDTRPISIVSVQRQATVEVTSRSARQQAERDKITDEFVIGKESAAVKGAVDTLAFRIVFTGYTENLRNFMKALEAFELPLVVRSIEVKPVSPAVRAPAGGRPGAAANSLDALFGGAAPDINNAAQVRQVKDPIVSENISEYTVVLEYITVTISGSN